MAGIAMSGIRQMFELAPKDAISLGLGEPDFNPPEFVLEAYNTALHGGKNKYSMTAGIPELRDALAERHRKDLPGVNRENVVVTAGSTAALFATMQVILDPGDEVLIPDPGFVLYDPHVRLAGGVPVPYPLRHSTGYLPQAADLETAITRKTKAVILNSPSNPTGSAFTDKCARELVDLFADRDILVITDEAYDQLVYDEKHQTMLGKLPNVLYVNSFSKTYAMTGWRLGYVVGSPEVADLVKRMNYHMVACPPTPTQYAGLAALTGPQDFTKMMRTEFRKRRDVIVKRLNGIDGFSTLTPQGAFYAFPQHRFKMDDKDLALAILKGGVVTTPGNAFGANGAGHLRLSYALPSERIELAMDKLEKAVKPLK
jgi:aspartate aminotransferase